MVSAVFSVSCWCRWSGRVLSVSISSLSFLSPFVSIPPDPTPYLLATQAALRFKSSLPTFPALFCPRDGANALKGQLTTAKLFKASLTASQYPHSWHRKEIKKMFLWTKGDVHFADVFDICYTVDYSCAGKTSFVRTPSKAPQPQVRQTDSQASVARIMPLCLTLADECSKRCSDFF